MKVLVTGGAGFIGSHLVDALIEAGHSVVVIDHHKKDKPRFPNEKAMVYKMSFHAPELEEVFQEERPDAVCHLAAQISVTHSVADPIADAQTNVVNSVHILDISRKYGVKRFLFSSSGGAIYGDHPERPTPEKYDAQPISPYGVAKQAFEHYLDLYRVQHGLSTLALRFSNVYGPRQMALGEASVVAIFLERLRTGRPATIFGTGQATRDYVFVKDAVAAFSKALTSRVVGTVNIATAKETSVLELWDTLRAIHGKEHAVDFFPFRPGEVERSVLSPALAGAVLDWTPQTSLEQGLRETYDWYMDMFGKKEIEGQKGLEGKKV